MKLNGIQPDNSKYLRNDAPRGGKEGDVFLVCKLAEGYEIVKTKKELAKEAAIEKKHAKYLEAKKEEAAKGRKQKSERLKRLAAEKGFKSVAAMKRAQDAICDYNNARMSRAQERRIAKFEEIEGRKYGVFKIADRVRLSRIELEFDCERKEDLYVG
jgi:hypothetical protein